MAKRKRAPHEKPFSRPLPKSTAKTTAAAERVVNESTDGGEPDSSEPDSNAAGGGEIGGSEIDGGEIDGGATDGARTDSTATNSTMTESAGADGIEAPGSERISSGSPAPEASDAGVAEQFVGQWNRLISTTNWEKGQIICEWREALSSSGVAVTEYSDEAWAQLVGGVTSQHVGRLRRVSHRFGGDFKQYEGLHWSHFQACLDWEDAEMWLEGSIQNQWSVSQMRGKRWETVGATPEEQQAEVDQVAAEQATEAQAEDASAQRETATAVDSLAPSTAAVNSLSDNSDASDSESSGQLPGSSATEPAASESADPANKRARLSVDVESLPDDLAEAFESFKLAIIAHRRENWRDTTPESVVECLDSLKQLALAHAE